MEEVFFSMKKILWFSRHEMTTEQYAALERKFNEKIEVKQISQTINSAFELQTEVEESDIVAIVAPIQLQAQFLKLAGPRPVILAQSKRELVKRESGEDEVKFIFEGWKQLKEIKVVMEDFC